MTPRRPAPIRVLVTVACALALTVWVAPTAMAAPKTVRYPSADCHTRGDHGLQDCIDSVPDGSTIVMTRRDNDGETATIRKNLTLRATNRTLLPRLDYLTVLLDEGPTSSFRITVQDVQLRIGVLVTIQAGSDHDVRLRRLVVGKGHPVPMGVAIETNVPSSVTLEGSYVRRADAVSRPVVTMAASDPDGLVRFKALGNRISGATDPDGGAGIELYMEGDGSVRAGLYNNAISRVASCVCGTAAGISIRPSGPIQGDVNIVGNSIDSSPTYGIRQNDALTGIGHLALDVFDDVFSRHANGAILLESGHLGFRAGRNAYYASDGGDLDGQSAGSGNVSGNPRFVDANGGDLRLRSTSPLIDQGVVCSPGGVSMVDAAGHARLVGSSVDIGAYERGAGAPTGVARFGTSGDDTLNGTSGADILCGDAGNDRLDGKGGRDYLDGSAGRDTLVGGSGSDRLYGRGGNDTLCTKDGVRGNDTANGGDGTDRGRLDTRDKRTSVEMTGGC